MRSMRLLPFPLLLAVVLLTCLTSGCHDHHSHAQEPAAILVGNDSPFFAVFSVDDCRSYQTSWLAPGESTWIFVGWTLDNGDLPGTILPCFFFQSFDGTVTGTSSFGPFFIEEGGEYSFILD